MEKSIKDTISGWYFSRDFTRAWDGFAAPLHPDEYDTLIKEVQAVGFKDVDAWIKANGMDKLVVYRDLTVKPFSEWEIDDTPIAKSHDIKDIIDKDTPLISIPKELHARLEYLGIIPNDVNSHNEGNSNYNDGTHTITPWAVWLDYPELTSWDHDIIKRVLRTKKDAGYTPEEQRILDYRKIVHDCEERIRQINNQIQHKNES